MKSNLCSIGDFSRMCRLTVKALRLYDEQGILKPGHVDPASGYRYYSSAQLEEAEMIRKLRSVEMPLEEIQRFMSEDSARRKALLMEHGRAIERQENKLHIIAASIEDLLEKEGDIMGNNVEIKELSGQNAVSVRFKTGQSGIGESLGKAYEELFGYLGGIGEYPAGPPFALYHDSEYKEENFDIEACVPISKMLPGEGEITCARISGGLVASTMHMGSYEGFSRSYEDIMHWINGNGYRLSGPFRETYLVGPANTKNPAEYRTEITIPIEKA